MGDNGEGQFSVLRRISACCGVMGQLCFFCFAFFFYWPAMWYADLRNNWAIEREYVGGVYTMCYREKGKEDWHCHSLDQSDVETMDHKWGHYVAIKTMVHFAETAALISLILFYVHLCVRNKAVAICCLVFTTLQMIFTLCSVSVASFTFDPVTIQTTDLLINLTYKDEEAQVAYSLSLVWMSWLASLGCLVVSGAVTFFVFKDKPEEKKSEIQIKMKFLTKTFSFR
ncbi:uncharacterized protein LOC134851590 [Symsagittifera roscoffensis]|uniref:uncharacterized protein LOC134851590 n=1 Tax=Symsagittifera roscoffensis TaxID=84072 RepID=UPI00307B4D11